MSGIDFRPASSIGVIFALGNACIALTTFARGRIGFGCSENARSAH
jgi:hypothetical protein